MKTQNTRRLARLNRTESALYGECFGYYMRNVRQDTQRADRHAWRVTCATFTRLEKYEGAKP